MSGPLQSSPAQINSPSNLRLDPTDSKSSLQLKLLPRISTIQFCTVLKKVIELKLDNEKCLSVSLLSV